MTTPEPLSGLVIVMLSFLRNLVYPERHIQHVLAKLCIVRGVLMKSIHYVPEAALRNIYFGIVYSYLQYGVTSWGNAACKYTRIQI